jgi:hypothetical protein
MDHQLTQSSGQPTGLLGRRLVVELHYVNQVREQSPTTPLQRETAKSQGERKKAKKHLVFQKIVTH